MNNIQELKQIIENAPEGATHVDSYGDYWNVKGKFNYVNWDKDCETWGDSDVLEDALSSLSDLRTIVDQAEEIEQLKSRVAELENNIYTYAVDHGDETPSVGLYTEVNGGKVIACSFNDQFEQNEKARNLIESFIDPDEQDKVKSLLKEVLELI